MTGGGAKSISPMRREKMRSWLESKLNNEAISGLKWMDREKNIFSVGWKHGSRLGWMVHTDGLVFLQWAKHTGIYRTGDKLCNKRWKANFRSALRSLEDVQEMKLENCNTSGPSALRIYKFTEPSKKKRKTKAKKRPCLITETCTNICFDEDAATQTVNFKETAESDSYVDEGLKPGLPSRIPTTVFKVGAGINLAMDSSDLKPMAFISQTTMGHTQAPEVVIASYNLPLLSELQIAPEYAKDDNFSTSGLSAPEWELPILAN